MIALDILRTGFAFAVVTLAPGWLLLHVRRPKFADATHTVAFSLALTFSLSLVLVSLLALLGWALSLPLAALAWPLLAIAILAAALYLREKGIVHSRLDVVLFKERLLERDIAFFGPWALVAVTVGLAAWQGVWMNTAGDQFYHLAAIRYLLNNDSLMVEDLIYADDPLGLDPTSGTWHTAMALMVRLSGLDVLDLWPHLTLFTAPLVVLAYYGFASYLLGNRVLGLVATAIQFVVFWALDFRDMAFPNHVGYILLWTGLTLSLRYIREGNRRLAVAAVVIAITLVLFHLILSEFFFISTGAYLVGMLFFWRRPDAKRELSRGVQLLAIVLVLVAPLILLRSDAEEIVGADVAEYSSTDARFRRIWPGPLLSSSDPIAFYPGRVTAGTLAYLATILLLPAALRGDRRELFLVTNMAVVPTIILNDPLVDFARQLVGVLPLRRLPFLLPSPLVIALVLSHALNWLERWGAREETISAVGGTPEQASRGQAAQLGLELRPPPSAYALGAFAFLVAAFTILGFSLHYGILDYRASVVVDGEFNRGVTHTLFKDVDRSRDTAMDSRQGVFGFLSSHVPLDTVVLADWDVSYAIAGLTGQPVVHVYPWHSPVRAEARQGIFRLAALRAVLRGEDFSQEEAMAALERWRVCYIIFEKPLSNRSLLHTRGDLFRVVYEDEETFAAVYRDGRSCNVLQQSALADQGRSEGASAQ